MVPLARLMVSSRGAMGGGAVGDGVADDAADECAAGDGWDWGNRIQVVVLPVARIVRMVLLAVVLLRVV